MTREVLLAEITEIFAIRADGHYGLSAITQKQHALQAAWLAERDGHPSAMIAAALMHDIGHMVHGLGQDRRPRVWMTSMSGWAMSGSRRISGRR